MANSSVKDAYDEIPYPSGPHELTHPGHIGALARLAGLETAPVNCCRVLEVGGSDGGNLLPIAIDFPDSYFACLDISPVQIEMGRYHSQQLDVKNLEFFEVDLTEFNCESSEKFDYIIAHGVYSWIDSKVQDQLLELVSRHLAPNGVGLVSYNTYPGWHLNMAIREMLLFHVRNVKDATERVRASISFLKLIAANEDENGETLKGAASLLLKAFANFESPESYLAHEYLSEDNSPLHFVEFNNRAGKAGLQVFDDANHAARSLKQLSPSTQEWINQHTSNAIEQQQYLDFFRCVWFRQSLLCHQDASLHLEFHPLKWESLFVSASVQPVDNNRESWKTDAGVVFSTNHEYAQAILGALGQLWPNSCQVSELAAKTKIPLEAVTQILNSLHDSLLVDVRNGPHCCTGQPSNRPCTSRISRYQIASGCLTTQRHKRLGMDNPIGRRILPLLDGSHNVQSIAAKLAIKKEDVDLQIEKIVRHGLVVS